MKKTYVSIVTTAIFALSAVSVMANTAIIDSLETQGVSINLIDDQHLDSIRGGITYIYGQPYPSATSGMKKHHITYKGYGSQSDYRSYNYVGNGYTPGKFKVSYGGIIKWSVGDQWLADHTSSPYNWNLAYTTRKDTHYQILDDTTYALTNQAYRSSSWNRPINKFYW